MQDLSKKATFFIAFPQPQPNFNTTACFPNQKRPDKPKRTIKRKRPRLNNNPFPFEKIVRYVITKLSFD